MKKGEANDLLVSSALWCLTDVKRFVFDSVFLCEAVEGIM